MTTFDEFVTTVNSKLAVRYPKSNMSWTMIQSVLSQTGIEAALQQKNLNIPQRKLQIRRIYISGHKPKSSSLEENVVFVYDRQFGPGLNGWLAGNGTGKSTILKAIVWGLTGVEQPFKQDIRAWIEDVAIEIIAKDILYTIRYFPRSEQPRVHGYIIENNLDFVMHNEAASDPLFSFVGLPDMAEKINIFFSEYLQFLPFSDNQSPDKVSDDVQRNVSWQTYAQALFIGSDYSDYLFPKSNIQNSLPGKPHQKVLSSYLGITSTDILTELELAREQARDEYKFESKRVLVNSKGVQVKIKELQIEISDIEERIQALDSGQSVLIDPAYLSHIQKQVALHTGQFVDLTLKEQQLLKEERESKKSIGEMQRACQELQEAIEFKVFLSGLSIERCPNCESDISQERIDQEIHTKHCRLCQSELQPIQSTEQYELLLKESQEKLNNLERQIKVTKKDLKRIVCMRQEEESQVLNWKKELQDLPRQEQLGFNQELRNLVERHGCLQGQLQQLQEQTVEVHSEAIQNLEYFVEIFDVAIIELQALFWQQHAIQWIQLQGRTAELAQLFGITDLELISFQLGERFDLYIKQGGKFIRYRNMEASEMLRLKLAFHLALLSVCSVNEVGHHPGILIVDAPGGAEMDDQHFQHILNGFALCIDQTGREFQIFIASTKDSVASICTLEQTQRLSNATAFF